MDRNLCYLNVDSHGGSLAKLNSFDVENATQILFRSMLNRTDWPVGS